jgi:signal transduction histidine kinase
MPDLRALLRHLINATLRVLRAHPVAGSLALTAIILVAPSHSGFASVAGFPVVCALTYCCGAHASLRDGGLAVAALIVAMQVNVGFSEFPNVEIAFPTLGPFWVGCQVRMRRTLVSRLEQRTRQLHEEHDAFSRLSVQRERARIARELHDIVAHHLAVIVVQAGAGRIAAPGPSQGALERFATIRQSGVHALAEMSRLVDLLHAEDAGTHDAGRRWRLLVDEARAGGIDVRIGPLPFAVQLPGDVDDDAYRIVREGLTNAIKHAPGAQVSVGLVLRDDDLQVNIHDDGGQHGQRLAETGSGLGLIGIRERVESRGGSLAAGPDPNGGWHLRVVLPVASPTVIPGW